MEASSCLIHKIGKIYGSIRSPHYLLGFLSDSTGKESACNMGHLPDLGRSPGEGKGYLLQYSGLENSMDYIVHGVMKCRTGLSDFHFKESTCQCRNCRSPGFDPWVGKIPQRRKWQPTPVCLLG